MNEQAEPRYDVVWPLSPRRTAERLQDRLDTLDGKVIAELWNHMYGAPGDSHSEGDKAYPLLREELKRRHPGVRIIEHAQFGNIHGADELEIVANLPARLAELGVDAVISAVGHCGSCTAAVMRATIAAEKAGYPTVSVVGSLFAALANLQAQMAGIEDVPLAVYPGRIPMDDDAAFTEKITTTIADQVVAGLTSSAPRLAAGDAEPAPREIVFSGTLDEVGEHFYANLWTDGMPVVPPTVDRVERFLAHVDRGPGEVVGVLQPEQREASIWSIAVNGVMAGCRPEYMPVLVAAVEAVSDPAFRVVDAASGAAWEPIITVTGPIIKQLDFNHGTGAQRVGRQANTSIGRFLNLYLRNIAGLRPGLTQKGGLGQTFFVALAEDEDAVRSIGWPTLGEDDGVPEGESAVTLHGMFSASTPMGEYEYGGRSDDPYTYLRPIVEYFGKGTASYWVHCGLNFNGYFPLLVLSPHCAKVLAAHGWTKDDVRSYLYSESLVPARPVLGRGWYVGLDEQLLEQRVRAGEIPPDFLRSTDPDRMIPSFVRPEWTRIIVAGNPDMYWQRGYVSNHVQGRPTTRIIAPSRTWRESVLGQSPAAA